MTRLLFGTAYGLMAVVIMAYGYWKSKEDFRVALFLAAVWPFLVAAAGAWAVVALVRKAGAKKVLEVVGGVLTMLLIALFCLSVMFL